MFILKIILGVMMVMASSSILAMPGISSLAICNLMSVIMLVLGIVAIIRFIEAKNTEKVAEKNGIPYLKTGIGSLLLGIAAVVLAILARSSETGSEIFIRVVTIIFGVWMIMDGVSVFMSGITLKKAGVGGWIAMMILGGMLVLAGIFCIVNIFAGLTAIGTIFGISMMFSGFALMFS